MQLLNPIKISYKNLMSAKGRSFLTILGIIIGVAAIAIFSLPSLAATYCDVNGDGKVNIKDIQECIRAIINPPGDPKADVNSDAKVNIKDIQEVVETIINPIPNSKDSPFGLMDSFTSRKELKEYLGATDENFSEKYLAWVSSHLQNIGSTWSKVASEHIIWGVIEPDLGAGYNWDSLDRALDDVFQSGEQKFIGVIVPNPSTKGEYYDFSNSEIQEQFRNFTKAIVERYDGDGIDDYGNPKVRIKYWQADNEPFARGWVNQGGTTSTYAIFLKILSEAAKEADSEAKIIMGSQIIIPESININDYSNIGDVISILKNQYIFDFVDVHYWPMNKNEYQMPVSDLRNILNNNGYANAKFVSLEHATIMNKNNQNPLWTNPSREQSEQEQAGFLIKSYTYNLSNGFSLILWSPFIDFSNYGGGKPCDSPYDYMGLISDGMCIGVNDAGIPRLSYYTYKKMTETLGGSDWDSTQAIQASNGIYVYKFAKNGKSIWVVWSDNSDPQTISLNVGSLNSVKITEAVPKYDSGKDVMDYNTAFDTEIKTVNNNQISITLGDVPVFAEE